MDTKRKPDGRGGARANSGPKPQTISQSQLKSARDAVNAASEKHGVGFYDICAEWVYDTELKIDRRQAAWKMLADKVHIQISEGSEGDVELGPAVYLPGKNPRLELVKDAGTGKD